MKAAAGVIESTRKFNNFPLQNCTFTFRNEAIIIEETVLQQISGAVLKRTKLRYGYLLFDEYF